VLSVISENFVLVGRLVYSQEGSGSLELIVHVSTHIAGRVSVKSQSHITTDIESTSPSWCEVPIWNPRPFFYFLEILF
jgi:hypothetical protein